MQIMEVNYPPEEYIGVFRSAELSIHAYADDIWWMCSSTITWYPNITVREQNEGPREMD